MGVPPAATVGPGYSRIIYFLDPEAINIERFPSSPWYVSQPFRASIVLSRPVDDLLSDTHDGPWGIGRLVLSCGVNATPKLATATRGLGS